MWCKHGHYFWYGPTIVDAVCHLEFFQTSETAATSILLISNIISDDDDDDDDIVKNIIHY